MEFRGKSEVIAATLREMIITGEIEAGAPLRQRDLATRFGVSPTPVREALRRLEAEGLVQHDLHRGATVIEASSDPDEEGYTVRAVLESLAARMAAARVTPAKLDELQALHDEFSSRSAAGADTDQINRRFHFAIYEASGSPVLLALLQLLWRSFLPASLVRTQSDSVKEHGAILEALRAGDPETAERATRTHVMAALQAFHAARRARADGSSPAV